jgi:hypothetical protein
MYTPRTSSRGGRSKMFSGMAHYANSLDEGAAHCVYVLVAVVCCSDYTRIAYVSFAWVYRSGLKCLYVGSLETQVHRRRGVSQWLSLLSLSTSARETGEGGPPTSNSTSNIEKQAAVPPLLRLTAYVQSAQTFFPNIPNAL